MIVIIQVNRLCSKIGQSILKYESSKLKAQRLKTKMLESFSRFYLSAFTFRLKYLIASVVALFLFNGYLCAAGAAVIKGETIEAAVRAYVKENVSWPKSAVQVEFYGRVPDLSLTGEKIVCRVRSGRNEDFIGDSSFIVRFYEKGVFLKKKTVRARIEVLMDIVVSAKSLSRNARIDSSDVRLIKRWFNRVPANIISSTDDVVGMKLRTSVKPNTQITENMVRSIPIVKRGKPVRIIFENGSMRITTMGLAEQDGMRGELIKVRNVSSRKIIYARVTGNSLVKVDF